MKTINKIKSKNIIISKAFFGTLIAFAFAFTPIYSANAGTNGGWSDFSSGYGGVYDYGNSGYGGVYDYGDSGYGGIYDYGNSGYGGVYDYGDSGYGGVYDYGYNYSTPSYGGSSYGGGGYSYTPAPVYDYVYNTPIGGGGLGGGSSAPQMQYVYSSNTNNNANANDNTNTNTVSNTFNPTNINNNVARINLIVYGGGGTNTPAPTPALNGNCVISPTVGYINQDISFSASASGGNGSYSYSWTGDNGINSNAQNFTGRYSYSGYKTATVTIRSGSDSITRTCGVNIQDTAVVSGAYCVANPTNAGINQNVTWTAYVNNTNGYYGSYSYSWTGSDNLYGNGQSISRSYNTPGYKTATVTMYGNGQSITATCNTNINGVLANQSNVTVIRDQNLGTPVSGVFLSQVPATGVGFGLKMTLFSVGLVLWSIFAAYMISRKKNGAFANKVNAFKLANMQKKGIIG